MLPAPPKSSEKRAMMLLFAGDLEHFWRSKLRRALPAFLRSPRSLQEIARQIATNSTTSIRRSPPSYLATNDWGLDSRAANSCCVSPAFLASIIRLQNALCAPKWTDLPSLRLRKAIGAGQ
jgi:hypothetical protein